MKAYINDGIDGLTLIKRLRVNSIFSGNKKLTEYIDSAISSTNGNDSYLSELVKIHEPIRKRVNQTILKSFEDMDKNLMTPQLKLVLQQVSLDALN